MLASIIDQGKIDGENSIQEVNVIVDRATVQTPRQELRQRLSSRHAQVLLPMKGFNPLL